jgi:hypothetical protein
MTLNYKTGIAGRQVPVSSKQHQSDKSSTNVSQPRHTKEAPVPADSNRSTRQVSPEVAAFIERVVVPALVKRYIAQSSTGERGE